MGCVKIKNFKKRKVAGSYPASRLWSCGSHTARCYQKSEQWITGQTESPETEPQKESPDLQQRSKGDSGEKRVSSLMGLHGGLCTFWWFCCDSKTALKNKVHFKQTNRSSRTSVHQGTIRSVTRPAEKRKRREPRWPIHKERDKTSGEEETPGTSVTD